MSKFFVIAALLVVAVACNKKEEAPATDAGTTVEQTAPATEPAPEAAPTTEAAPAEGTEAAPADAAPAQQ